MMVTFQLLVVFAIDRVVCKTVSQLYIYLYMYIYIIYIIYLYFYIYFF